jgi:dipeptidyl aminopeptidase/acylaminoacyl peptidase
MEAAIAADGNPGRGAEVMLNKRTVVAAVALVFFTQMSGRGQAPTQPGSVSTPNRKATATRKAPSPMAEAVHALFAAHSFEQAAISPDGKSVAWIETLVDRDGAPTGHSAVYIGATHGTGAPRRISAGNPGTAHAEGSVAWSPSGKQIAFLSDASSPGQLQLYVTDAAPGPARKLTGVKGFLAAPGWSPDGKTIALLFTENATRAAGPLVAATQQTGEIKETITEQRLAVVDVQSGALRQISPADMYVYEFDWSPDGKRFVATAAHGNGDNNWYIAEIYTLDATGQGLKSIYKPPLQIGYPRWSPDGTTVAFVAGLMSDEPAIGGDVYVVHENGDAPKNLTPDMKASASWLAWTPEGKILFGEYVEGDAGFATVDPGSGRIETLFRGSEELTAGSWGPNLSLARDGNTSAVVRSSFSAPPEVWAGAIGTWKPMTKRNAGLGPAWGDAKDLRWKSEGYDVQGWLIYPRPFDPAKKYPMIVNVHGGPGAAVQPHWPEGNSYPMALAAAGYFLLLPNPRGSFGQGQAFTRANVRDFGYGDFRDILAGVDEAVRIAPVDPERLGLTGWSYGGFMTMWGVTQTNRFKAAMAGAGISNFQSYYGQNLIDKWMIPFFGASVYDDPAVYAKSSAINFVKNVKTPTLILVGDSDGECPPPQSYEFWHALRTLGVETQLVVYEHEGHAFAKPAHQRDKIARTVAWFDAHLK